MLLLQELNVLGKGKRSDMGDEWEYFFKSEKRILRVCYSKELGEYVEWNKVSVCCIKSACANYATKHLMKNFAIRIEYESDSSLSKRQGISR